MYIALLCIALYIGAFQYHLLKLSACISLYHIWQYRGYTLRTLQATKHYQIWCGCMRSRIHQIQASSRVISFSLSSIVQRLQVCFYYLLSKDKSCAPGCISDRRIPFVRSEAILNSYRRHPVTGLLLAVFLIGAISSNRSTGLAHVPCLCSIGKPTTR